MSHKSKLVAALALFVILAACSRSPQSYLEKGNKLAAQGKYTDAALNYRKAIQKDERFGEAYFQLGSVNLQLGKASDAYQYLVRAAELLPARDDVKVKLADLALRAYIADKRRPAKLYDQIQNVAGQLQKKNPNSFDAFRLNAYLALSELRYDDAKELFRRANQVKPLDPQIIVGWTQVLFFDKENAEGEKLAHQLIDHDKTYKQIYDVLLAHYGQLNNVAEAEKVLKLKTANNPTDTGSVLQLAAFYLALSKPDEMKAVLQRMVANAHDFPRGHLNAGDFYMNRQRWDEALAEYEQGAKAQPKDKVLYLKRIGDAWLAQGKGEQAGKVADEILKQEPGDESAKAAKASLLLASGNPQKVQQAVNDFQALVDKTPENPVWHFNLGRSLAAKGDLGGAQGQFQEAIKKRGDFVPPRLALARLSASKGDAAATLRYANDILRINPNVPEAKLLRGIGLSATDAAKGREELAALEKQFPRNEELQFQLVGADLKQKKFQDAEDRLRKLLQANPGNLRALSAMVQAYGAQKQLDRAVPLLEERLKQADSDPVRLLLAQTSEALRNYDGAIQQYQRLLSKNPKSAAEWAALGRVYTQKGDLPSALAALQKATGFAPKDGRVAASLGDALAVSNRKQEAIPVYRRALELQPDNALVMNNLAFMIAETGGNLDEALKLMQKAIEKAPKQPNFSDTLGWIYLKKNLDDSAVQVFRGLTTAYAQNPTFHYHLALALLQKGDRASAKKEMNTALGQKPSAKVREDIQAALAKIG